MYGPGCIRRNCRLIGSWASEGVLRYVFDFFFICDLVWTTHEINDKKVRKNAANVFITHTAVHQWKVNHAILHPLINLHDGPQYMQRTKIIPMVIHAPFWKHTYFYGSLKCLQGLAGSFISLTPKSNGWPHGELTDFCSNCIKHVPSGFAMLSIKCIQFSKIMKTITGTVFYLSIRTMHE